MPIESIKWAPGTPANPRGRRADFLDLIDADLTDALGVHDALVKTWIRWLELYRAPVKQPERNIPYEGAANFMLPTIATDSDQLYAKFIQTIHAAENLWTLKPLNERWTDAAKPLQDLLTWLDGSVLKMYNVNKRVIAEMVKLGTGIYKTGWTYERRPIWTYNERGQVIEVEKTVGRPFVDHVRLADFVFPPNAYAIDPDAQGGAQWVAERIRVKKDTLRWMAESQSPLLPNIEKSVLEEILKHEEAGVTEWDQAVQSADYEKRGKGHSVDFESDGDRPAKTSGGQPAPSRHQREIELWEVHARFPTGRKASEDDVICWYHRPTKKIVRGVYQYYRHGKRPYEVVRLFPGDGFYGIGMCENTELFQLVESDLFNFTHDNVLLSNSRMFVARSGSNIAPGEPIFPGKVFMVDGKVGEDFASLQMGDIYQSLPMLQEFVAAKRERRNGMGDLQMGNMQSLPSRTPATTTLSLLQEGARRPDMTVKDMRYEGVSDVGLRILQILQQYVASPQDVGGKNLLAVAVHMLGAPEGEAAAEKLLLPMENVEFGIGCAITATSGSNNKETQKQDYLALMQIFDQSAQTYMSLAQAAVQFAGTPMGDVAATLFNAKSTLSKRLLETYDIRDIEQIVPSAGETAGISASLAAPPVPGAAPGGVPAGAQPGPGGQPAAAAFDPSVANLYGGAQQAL